MVAVFAALTCIQCFAAYEDELYEERYNQAIECASQGEIEDAKRYFQDALALRPGDEKALQGIEMCNERLYGIDSGDELDQSVDDPFAPAVPELNIRLGVGSLPGVTTLKANGINYDLEEDGGAILELSIFSRSWAPDSLDFLGGCAAGGIHIESSSGKARPGTTPPTPSGFELEDGYTAGFGFFFQAGVCTRIGDYLVFDVQPYISLSAGSQEVTFSDGTIDLSEEATTWTYSYGAKAAAYVLLGDRWEIGAEYGWTKLRSSAEDDDGNKWKMYGQGDRIVVSLAYKF